MSEPRTAVDERAGRKETDPAASMASRYRAVRRWSSVLCEPLAVEDYVVQSFPDASPAKWHLAHTTWFFETLVLEPHLEGYETSHPTFGYLFNSYYNSLGKQFFRPERGLLSRPTVEQVHDYRARVDEAMLELLARLDGDPEAESLPLVEIGMQHEQQHQELMLTDLKHMFSRNPLHPIYREQEDRGELETPPLDWHDFAGGLVDIGNDGDDGFAYDNEGPRHRVYLEPFRIGSRAVTCGEYLQFMRDGGYERPDLWLSDGWATVRDEGWEAPLYWLADGTNWMQFTLAGLRPVRSAEPVCHVSLYEADAYARWARARLATEAEWEVAADSLLGRPAAAGAAAPGANFVEDGHYHPRALPGTGAMGTGAMGTGAMGQFLGDVWEWTRSAYLPYPGYRPPEGPLGEYNAKFMNSQTVLRGGSCATPRSHIRTTYRNFFPAETRWQFSGIRLARDA